VCRPYSSISQPANDKTGVLWNSLASALQRLAEAAPDAFLNGVRNAEAGADPVIARLFTDTEATGVPAESSRHHHLL
jgi:hypothetical protein